MKAARRVLYSLGLVVVIYALSIGPVWRFTRGFEDDHEVSQIYMPLIWLCLQSKPLNDAANWYLTQWYELKQSN